MHKMATNQPPSVHADENSIEMELSSSSNFLCYFISSPPQTREFEFQVMTSISCGRESKTSPADELFYKGKLLPLNLPTRLQVVQSSSTEIEPKTEDAFEEKYYSSPFITITGPTTADSTNSNISLSESCRFSSELSPGDCFLEWSIEKSEFIGIQPKKSWAKKLKQIKQFALAQKLKASSSYLKTMFSKSGCSDASYSARAACTPEAKTASKDTKDCQLNKFMKVPKKNPFGKKHQISTTWMKSIDGEMLGKGTVYSQRRSFSGVIQRASDTKSWSSSTSYSGSSSFSFGSSGSNDLQLLKRINCSMVDSELESSIEGAIAHCKQSQQLFTSSKLVSDVASKNDLCWDREKRGLCII